MQRRGNLAAVGCGALNDLCLMAVITYVFIDSCHRLEQNALMYCVGASLP